MRDALAVSDIRRDQSTYKLGSRKADLEVSVAARARGGIVALSHETLRESRTPSSRRVFTTLTLADASLKAALDVLDASCLPRLATLDTKGISFVA